MCVPQIDKLGGGMKRHLDPAANTPPKISNGSDDPAARHLSESEGRPAEGRADERSAGRGPVYVKVEGARFGQLVGASWPEDEGGDTMWEAAALQGT